MPQFILIFHWQDDYFPVTGEQAKWSILVLKIADVTKVNDWFQVYCVPFHILH